MEQLTIRLKKGIPCPHYSKSFNGNSTTSFFEPHLPAGRQVGT